MQVKERDLMGGFAKGLKVIEAFGAERPKLSISQAAAVTSLDRATVRRCLLTLAELGFCVYDGKFFSLTPKVLRLGHAWLSATPLPSILQPCLDALSEKVGHSASASVMDGTDIVYIARASQRRVMSITLTPGSRLPAYCASMGRVLLAAMTDTDAMALLGRSTLVSHTPSTITEPEALMAEIRRVRAQGYCVVDQELEIGLCSIAVPVADINGRVIAAMNIGIPAAIFSADGMEEHLLTHLREAQAAIRLALQ